MIYSICVAPQLTGFILNTDLVVESFFLKAVFFKCLLS